MNINKYENSNFLDVVEIQLFFFFNASLFMNISSLSICEICWLALIKKWHTGTQCKIIG